MTESAPGGRSRYVFVPDGSAYVKLQLDDICCIEADGWSSRYLLADGSRLAVSSPLGLIEKELPAGDFLRIHKSVIVNIRHVERLYGTYLVANGRTLPLGRQYKRRMLATYPVIGSKKRKKPCSISSGRR